jgi:hypothetical protein
MSSAKIELEQLIESDDESSSGSSETQTEQRRVVEKNRQDHRDNLYQQARAAAAAHPLRRSGVGARGEQRKLDAFLPKHAERAAKLEKIARESSTSWADDLRRVGGDSAARGGHQVGQRAGGSSGATRQRALKNRNLPRVEPPRWRSGDTSVDRRQVQDKDTNDRRDKRRSTSGANVFTADGERQRKRRRSVVPLDEDEEDEDGANGVQQQQWQRQQQQLEQEQPDEDEDEDEDEDDDNNVVVRRASGGKRRRNSRRLLLDSDDDGSGVDGANTASDSGSD